MTDTANTPEVISTKPEWNHQYTFHIQRLQLYSGLAFMLASATIILYTFASFALFEKEPVPADLVREYGSETLNFIEGHFDIFAGFALALLSGWFGLWLFSKINANYSQVIRKEDRALLQPLIETANVEAINQYIRLSSLSGWVGAFTKVGFTGLPLATVSLTIIFVISALFYSDKGAELGQTATTLFDMAKLTLGAFIGSFVQRQVEQKQNSSDAGQTSGSDSDLPV